MKRHEQLTTLIQALEDAGETEYADKKRKELAKIKAPPMHRPAQDRACLNARLAELEEMSEKKTAQLHCGCDIRLEACLFEKPARKADRAQADAFQTDERPGLQALCLETVHLQGPKSCYNVLEQEFVQVSWGVVEMDAEHTE